MAKGLHIRTTSCHGVSTMPSDSADAANQMSNSGMLAIMQKAVAAYGCFVDIGAEKDGLVHVSQLSSGYVKDVNEFVSVGQQVLVKVLGIESNDKMSLSMKTSAEEGAVSTLKTCPAWIPSL